MGKHSIRSQTPPCLSSAGKEFGAEDRNGKTSAKQPTGPQQLQGLSMALPGQRFPPHAGLQGPPLPWSICNNCPCTCLLGNSSRGANCLLPTKHSACALLHPEDTGPWPPYPALIQIQISNG